MKVDVVLRSCKSKPGKDLGEATYEALFTFEDLESFQALSAFTNQALMLELWKRQIDFDDLKDAVVVVNSEPTPIEALALENGHHNQPPTRGRKRKNEEDGP